MNRFGLALLGISLLASSDAFAQKASAVVSATKPALVCPQAEMGNVDQQAKYDTMWQEYSKSVEDASRKLRDEIETQTKSATSAGNLDLALFWKALARDFDQKGELRWDDTSLKRSWSDRFGDSSYPTRFVVAVKKASQAFASATEDLEKGYGELVADFTKAEKLEEALKIRGELKNLLAEKALTPNPETTPKSKPEPAPKPKPEPVPPIVGVWISDKGWGKEFLQDKTARNLTPKGEVDTIGTWKEEGPGQYSARLGAWYWQIILKGDEIEAVHYLDGQLKGHNRFKRRR
jgi:hypothetical protein